MDTTDKTTPSEPVPDNDDNTAIAPYTLLYITRAYNRHEITLKEWLRLTKDWAERMIKQYKKE